MERYRAEVVADSPGQLRCKDCLKTAFWSEEHAMEKVKKIRREDASAPELRPYLGNCDWWHLSSKPLR